MNRERAFEVVRNIGSTVKDKAYYTAYAAGGAIGVYATGEGLMTGNKAETAIGITSGAVTTIKIASKFIHREMIKRSANTNSSS